MLPRVTGVTRVKTRPESSPGLRTTWVPPNGICCSRAGTMVHRCSRSSPAPETGSLMEQERPLFQKVEKQVGLRKKGDLGEVTGEAP